MNHRLSMSSNPSPSSRFAVVSMVVMIFCLLLTNVLLSSELSQVGSRLTQSELKARSLSDAADKIQQELALNSALTILEAQAQKLGFTQNVQYLNVSTSPVVALKH
jgi:hypothetical protein